MTALRRLPFLLVMVTLAGALQGQDAQPRRGFSIKIIEPVDQSLVLGKTRIQAEVKIDHPDLVQRVEFIVGDKLIFVDREKPYECFHDFGEGTRSWVIRAVAHHREGVSVSDAVVTRKLEFAAIERVNRVVLWILAQDKRGQFIHDLKAEDFKVYEEGVEQQVLTFEREERPITLAILLDTSGSMQEEIKQAQQAASSFIDTLRPEDQALVIDFDHQVFLLQDLTSDHELLREAIESTEPLGGTALYDALHAAYRKIGTIEGRKAIVLLSDGADFSSKITFERIADEAKANDTMIYAVGLGGGEGGPMRRDVLKELTELTGGTFFPVKTASELEATYQQVADDLRSQYHLAYQTTNNTWDGRFIKIEVRSTRPEVNVRSRQGYLAVRSAGAPTLRPGRSE